MPFTIAYDSTPNQTIAEWSEGHEKCRRVTLTFDASYATGGEVLTAAEVGWSALYAFVPEGPAVNAAGTADLQIKARANAAKTQLNFFAYTAADAEQAAAANLATFAVTGVLRGA